MILVPTGHADRWLRTWRTLELPAPASSILQELFDHYSQKSRSYHTIQHLDECFREFDLAWRLMQNPGEVELALWFHDAIYETHTSDNEERSAHWARSSLRAVGASDAVQHRVVSLILATKHNAEPDDHDARLTVDIDLCILGAAR
jgi:predicted metal-dependent HD superfamily phosphohydrolase